MTLNTLPLKFEIQKRIRAAGLARASGHIGFLGHGTRVEFRNIRIRLLD